MENDGKVTKTKLHQEESIFWRLREENFRCRFHYLMLGSPGEATPLGFYISLKKHRCDSRTMKRKWVADTLFKCIYASYGWARLPFITTLWSRQYEPRHCSEEGLMHSEELSQGSMAGRTQTRLSELDHWLLATVCDNTAYRLVRCLVKEKPVYQVYVF